MHRLALFEDCIRLDLPDPLSPIDINQLNWIQYNPRKYNHRYGCSITSLDGLDSGIPDLDSVLEFNIQNQTTYIEKDFNKPTVHSAPFANMLNQFQVGRCHFIKLEAGGFFPWHRDVDPTTFRIVYTIDKCEPANLVWLEDDKILSLDNNRWYYINTRKKHAVFSFSTSVFAVFNVLTNAENLEKLFEKFHIK